MSGIRTGSVGGGRNVALQLGAGHAESPAVCVNVLENFGTLDPPPQPLVAELLLPRSQLVLRCVTGRACIRGAQTTTARLHL